MSCRRHAGGTYIIEAVYNGTTNFGGDTDTSQDLAVSAAASATAAASASATFSGTDQNVTLNATITSTAGIVNEGTETFTILNGTTVVGTAVTVNVCAGAASAVYVLPAARRRHVHHRGRVQRHHQLPAATPTTAKT